MSRSTLFSSSVRRHAELTKEKMIAVMRNSVQEVMELAQTPQPPARVRQGPPEIGKVPVDEAYLRNSLISGLDGSFGAADSVSYVLTIAQLTAGHVANFAWTMPYAMRIEYGFFGEDSLGRLYNQQGAHFVGANAAKWDSIVNKQAARVKT